MNAGLLMSLILLISMTIVSRYQLRITYYGNTHMKNESFAQTRQLIKLEMSTTDISSLNLYANCNA